jgi:two-component system, NarL family, response regulator
MSTAPIRLLLVDDHPMLLQGLAATLRPADGFEVVATAGSVCEAIAAHQRERPQVTVLDLRLGEEDGTEVIRAVRRRDPGARFLVLSTFDAEAQVRGVVEAGAAGYLLKTAPPATLVGAIRAVHAGLRVLPPELAAQLAEHAAIWDLTPRERSVLRAAAEGDTNKEIAVRLGITEGTVKGYLVGIFAKLGVESRTQAIAKAAAKGMVELGGRPRRP